MKNFGKQYKQFKQTKQFYQGTGVGFYGQYTRIICHTQKASIFFSKRADGGVIRHL
jgi:hypothetical protein